MANKDTLIKMFEGIRDERTKHANTARRIGNAFLSMLDFASSAGDGKLSSVHDDIAQGFITFVKGLMSIHLAQLKGGASFGSDGSYSFDKDGNLVIESAHSRDFDEMLQNGFALKRNPTSGKYTLSISDLIVWGRMVINTLETRKKYAIGGNVYLSGASSKIQHVEKVYSEDGETVVGYKCYILKDDGTMATQNGWVVGDQALCQTFDIEEGVYQNVSNQYYWRLVTQVSEENVAITEKYIDKDGNEQIRELYEGQKFAWVVLSKDDCDKNSGVPASGDTIVMDGHRLTENEDIDYTERTNVLMLEATGSGSPRIIALTGIVDYKHATDNEVFILSPQKVIFTTEHFEIRTASGAPITFVHFMGPWVKGTEYHYYDQVSHANALWTCIVEKGKSTTDEPTDGNAYWRKEMSGGKGEKGDDAVSYTLEASPGYIRLNSDGSIDYTNGYIDKGDGYGSDKYLVVRGYKVAKGVRDNRFSTEASPITLRLTINDGSAYSEYTPSDGDSVSIDFEPKYEDSYYSMLEEISHSGLNSVRVDMCEGSEYNPNKILATCDIPITQNGKDGQKGDDAVSYNINFVTYKDDVHNDTILYVYVVRSVGKDSTSTLISNIPEISETAGLEVRVYCDGDYNENLTNHVKWCGSIQRSAWETVKNFEVRLYLDDKLVSSNSYSFGEQGESALEILVTPEMLVFDTNNNGLVPPGTSKQASISCYRNGVKVTNVSYSKSAVKNCSASVSESNGSATVTISEITSQEVADTIGNSSTISNTSGYATIQVWDKDTNLYHRIQVKFMVNVAKFTGQMVNTNKRFSLQHEELSNAVKDKVGSLELKQFKGEITQTAREISLSVSEKSIGRRNLLVGSAFRRQGEVSYIIDSHPYFIRMNDGYGGTNCAYMSKSGMTQNVWCGAMWNPVTVKPNTKYTFSMMLKVTSACDERFDVQFIDVTSNSSNTSAFYTLAAADKMETFGWTLKKITITTPSLCTKLRIDAFIRRNGTAYMCRPMLEEGENYNGWTLSEQDYDYVGGNMLDNARTLDKSGTLVIINDTVIQNGYGTDSACAKNLMQANATLSDYKEVLRWVFGSMYLVNGNDYIFSFVAKADVDDARVVCYMWSGDIENSCGIFTEGNGGTWDSRSDGSIVFILSRQWTRYWVHWRPKDGYATPKEVIIRHTGNNSTSAPTVYVTQPKLEIGATMTEWTERKTDLVDKASLKEAGILVDAESVTLYGNQVHIKRNKTDADDTVLIDNETGKVSAGLIDADEVVAKGIRAKNLEATNLNVTGNSKFGIWEIRKDDTFGEMIQARGDLQLPSGHTAQGSGVQYLPLYIRGGLANANYFRVGVSCTEFSYSYNGRDFCGVWTGKAADYVCGSVANTAFNTPTEYGYDESYHPAEYIYATKSLPNDPALAINVVKTNGSDDGERTAIQTNAAIRGVLAPNSMSISWYDTIPSGIGVVICTNGSEITLTLPANPIEGQTLIIIQGSDKRVYIVPYGDEVIYCGGQTRDKSNKFFSGTIGQFNIFVFIRGNWQLQFVNNRP